MKDHVSLALKSLFVFQGFLSDLLKKANRPYDEPKLQEYTQTIVSGQAYPSSWGAGLGPQATGVLVCRVFGSLLLQVHVK